MAKTKAHDNPILRRIAQLKIDTYGLSDTVDEYITKCVERTKNKDDSKAILRSAFFSVGNVHRCK